ncbi:UDP-N-acetylmuramoyl-tripeptide--D-alanyl-D-alanine ligase, partial [bacterium]
AARRKAGFKVAAISGSFGKTTTKELALSLFAKSGKKFFGTAGNLNNLIGLPQTILGAEGDEEYAVLELGISLKGEMEELSAICEPDVALLTGVGIAHTEGLGDLEGVAREKVKIAASLREGGVLIVPFGDRAIEKAVGELEKPVKVKTFGWEKGADWHGENLEELGAAGSRFTVDGVLVNVALAGRHNAQNALAAIALTGEMGISPLQNGQISFAAAPQALRGEIAEGPRGSKLLIDCYNANPSAVVAAIDTLVGLAGGAKKILVLGDMRELGAKSEEEHRKIGSYAAKSGVARIYLLGEEVRFVKDAALKAGMANESVKIMADNGSLSGELAKSLKKGDWVL